MAPIREIPSIAAHKRKIQHEFSTKRFRSIRLIVTLHMIFILRHSSSLQRSWTELRAKWATRRAMSRTLWHFIGEKTTISLFKNKALAIANQQADMAGIITEYNVCNTIDRASFRAKKEKSIPNASKHLPSLFMHHCRMLSLRWIITRQCRRSRSQRDYWNLVFPLVRIERKYILAYIKS